ncbi:MAG TPA: OmpP1/FadL family transporter [Beijerinckiaceae bacterium]|nr:OmpP1/FadL family transporter [Beijerinckiaceae bacterium]
MTQIDNGRGDMRHYRKSHFVLAAIVLALGGASRAQAGAFLIREQGAAATALSTAGAAAGGVGLSSMFWNPATITDAPGWQSSWSVSGVFPSATITAQPGSALLPLGASSGQILRSAAVPASYSTYQLNDRWWLGLAVNSPFGLASRNPNVWAGSPYGIDSKVSSFDINPTIGFKLNRMISFGVGLQAEWLHAYQSEAIDLPPPFGTGFGTATIKGSTWGWGFTAGATVKPWRGTELGVGYRSSVRETTDSGKAIFSAFNPPTQPLPPGVYPASFSLPLPDIVTIGVRQRVTPLLTLLGGFEWDHWSRLGAVAVTNPGPGPLPPAGAVYTVIPFNYRDGWLASLGAQYQWSPKLVLRGGLAYERSPIDDANRSIALPDSDRVWVSIGAGYRLTPKLSADVAYAHLFAQAGTITETTPVPFVATTEGHADIISVSLNYRWDNPSPPRPVVARY